MKSVLYYLDRKKVFNKKVVNCFIMELHVEKVRSELARIGKNQSDLAEMMGVSRALVSYWFKAKKVTHVQRIADALGFSGKDLIKE